MDTSSAIGTGLFAIIAASWAICTLVSVGIDLRGGISRWWSRASA